MTTLLDRILGAGNRRGLGLPPQSASQPTPAPVEHPSFVELQPRKADARSAVPAANRANTSLAVWNRHEDIPQGAEVLTAQNGKFDLSDEQRKLIVVLRLKGNSEGAGALVIGWTNNREDNLVLERVRALARQKGFTSPQMVEIAPDLIGFLNFDEPLVAKGIEVVASRESSEAIDELSSLIKLAAEQDATDIHILMDSDKTSVMFRLGQYLTPRKTLRRGMGIEIARAMHSMSEGHDSVTFNASMPTCENAKLFMTVKGAQGAFQQEVRWASAPTTNGNFDITLRLLGSTIAAESFTQLGFDSEQDIMLRSWMEKRSGLIGICGTTSSGKSTTLKTACELIMRIRDGEALHTIESPVEYKIKGARQRNVTDNNSVAQLLRQEMRMNPNILMVGEVRDEETASGLSQAVTTGHLVLSTLHTSDQFALVERLGGLGIDATTVADKGFLAGLVHQALVPLLCPECAVPAVNGLKDERLRRLERIVGATDGLKVRGNAPDCPRCNGRGTKGATVVASLVAPDFEMLTHFRKRELNLARLYRASGMQANDIIPGSTVLSRTTQQHAVEKMRAGLISVTSFGALEVELAAGEAKAMYQKLLVTNQ